MQTTACNHSATLVPSKTFDIDSYHVNSILNKLFRSLRDGEDRPATENLIAFMVDRGITRADAEECVNRCCNIFQVALKSCVGNREEACVLCAMELRASYGCCRDGQAQIVNLLGFRRGNEVVRQAMEVFLIDGWIEVVHDEESEDYFELIHPISNWESEGTGSVELLRMEVEELGEMPEEEFRRRLMDTVLVVAQERLHVVEEQTIAEMDKVEQQLEADNRLANEVLNRINEQRSTLFDLRRLLSKTRWAWRDSFNPDSFENMERRINRRPAPRLTQDD